MRSVLAVFILMVIVSSAVLSAEPAKDPRLSQKINYQVKLRPIAGLTTDLSKLTHVTFTAGRASSDWRVREDCATVIAKDVSLATLMDSIAHALKFRWVRTGVAPNYSYRLTEDPDAIAAIDDREEADKQKLIDGCRRRWDSALATAAMSSTDLERIKDSDPWMYFAAKAGVLQPTVEFFQQVPEAKDAFLSGGQLKLAGCWLSPKGKQAMIKTAQAVVRMETQLKGEGQDALPSRLADIESRADQLTIEITGSAFAVQVDGVTEPGGIPTTDNDFLTMIAQNCIKAYEQNRPLSDLIRENRPQLKAAVLKERQRLQAERPALGCDPGATHPDDLLRADLLKDKAESKVITGLIASVADASGYAIVTADLRGSNELSFAKGASVRETLDKLAEAYGWNWNKNGHSLEIWPSDWHERRESRVSNAWLESIKNKLKTNGTLDIDDLSQIAALNDGQFSRLVKDEDLACLAGAPAEDREFLKIYALFSAEQRSTLFSGSGLLFAELAPEQKQPILKQLKSIYIPILPNLDLERLGFRIIGTKEKQGQSWLYKLSAAVGKITIPGQYEMKTPVYVQPPAPKPSADGDGKLQPVAIPAAQ